MREVFHQSLEDVQSRLVEIAELVTVAIERATKAFGTSDVTLAEEVIEADQVIDDKAIELDELAIQILARQQPVARDLRIVVAALRVSASLERMGDIAEHIAQLTRMRFPERAIPKGLKSTFTKMGEIDVQVANLLTEILRTEDLALVEKLRTLDDQLDDLHLSVFEKVLSENWQGEAGATVDATLASRYHERFADHALSVAKKVAYLATGEWTPDTDSIAVIVAADLAAVRETPAGAVAGWTARRRGMRAGIPLLRGSGYFLPWLATAAAPAAAASGSRYAPGSSGMKSSPSR